MKSSLWALQSLEGYLFFCGVLAHFLTVLLVLTLVAKPSSQHDFKSLIYSRSGPLEDSKACTHLFKGQKFDWENPLQVQSRLENDGGFEVRTTYQNLGLKGQTAAGFNVYQVSFELEMRSPSGQISRMQPLGRAFFEVDTSDRIERCHVKVSEDRVFDCLLSRGDWDPKGGCLLHQVDRAKCLSVQGQPKNHDLCLILPKQDLPRDLAGEFLARAEKRQEPCEVQGWYRTIECFAGGQRCRPVSQCRLAMEVSN